MSSAFYQINDDDDDDEVWTILH